MVPDFTARLAKACARGWRQESLVNELMAGSVKRNFEMYGITYGDTRLQHGSWKNLRSRLTAAGFVVQDNNDKISINLKG